MVKNRYGALARNLKKKNEKIGRVKIQRMLEKNLKESRG